MYGFHALPNIVTDCGDPFYTIGKNFSRSGKIELDLQTAKQQIKDITISYQFIYYSDVTKIQGLSISLQNGLNTQTLPFSINAYNRVSSTCNYYTFNLTQTFADVSSFLTYYSSFAIYFNCYTIENSNYQSVSYVTIYVNYLCPLKCSSCDSNQNCLTCISQSYSIALNPNTNLYYCKLNCEDQFYATLPDQLTQSQTCKLCVQNCQTCTNGQDCQVCYQGFEFVPQALKCLPKCNTNQYRDSSYQCQNCVANCLECTGAQDCKTCQNSFIFNSSLFQCICPTIGYFLDSNGNCNQCDPSCQQCSGPLESNCSSCFTNWFSLGGYCYQWCPNNYQKQLSDFSCVQCDKYVVPDCQTCYQTCRSCPYNQQNTCLDCYNTRQLINGKCNCKNSADTRDLYFECSYGSVAVLQSSLDKSSPILKIDFGVNLFQDASLQCNQIFKEPTLSAIGKTATCTINSTFIQVQLSDDSIIKENDEISLEPGVLSYQLSSTTKINTFYLLKVSQDRDQSQNPSLDFQYDQVQNTCNDVKFSVKANNDAQRGFLYLQWSIKVQPLLEPSIQSQVDQIIQTANTQKSQTIIFEKYLLPPDSQLTVEFSYTLKVNWQGTQKFTTNYVKAKQIVISTIQSQYPPIYRFYSLSIFYSFYVQSCDQKGLSIFMEPLNISLQSQLMPSLNQNYPSFSDSQIEVDIQPFSISVSSTLDLNLKAVLISDQTISGQNVLSIQPQLANLFIQIQGGQTQLVSYKQPLTLQGIATDFELQDDTAPQGINLSWSCQSIVENNGDNQCYNQKKQVYNIQQTGLSITIPGKTFSPYQTLNFTLKGTKDSRQSQSSVLIILSEFDLPPLTVIFLKPQQLETVNLNEDITAKLVYGANVSSDILTYAGAIIYDDDVQGVIKFDFYEIKIRIWDYYSNVLPTNKIVQLRFTVYNPVYVMPSMSVINLNVNIPPNNCILNVVPSNGQALITNFYIKMAGCSSDNLPITYQFFYYLSQDDLNSEIKNPNLITRRQILDQTTYNDKNTFLPEGKIIVMAQAIDSKLGVFNSTVQVQVSPLNCDEQTLLNMIDSVLNSNNSQLISQIVLNLSVVGEQISKNQTLFNLPSVNQRKLLIVEQLIKQSSLLPKSSFLYTYSNKVISQLQSSLPDQSDTQVSSVLDQVSKQLSKQPFNSQLANDNNVQLQSLVDCFKIVNSTTQKISYNMLPTQINISNSICNKLNNQTLPNQGGIQLTGNMINLDCQLITFKNLQQYMQVYSSPPSGQTDIYNAANLVISQNPYKETPEFKSYTSQLQQAHPTLKISYNQVIQPNITNTNTSASSPLNATVVLQFPNANTSSNSSNMTCIQQQKTAWSTQGCQTLKSININGYYCYCDKQNPTTIIDDLSSVLDNKNLQTAFSSQGIENISNFSDFYKFAIFWFLSFLTVVQFGLYFYGSFLDKKYQGGIKFYKTLSRVTPINDQNNQEQFQRESYSSINQQQSPFQQPLNTLQIPSLQQQDSANEILQKQVSKQIQSKRSVSLYDYALQKDQQQQLKNQKDMNGLKITYASKNSLLLQDNAQKSKQKVNFDNFSKNLDILNEQADKQQQHAIDNQIEKKSIISINIEQIKDSNKETALKLTSNISNEQILENNEDTQKKSTECQQITANEVNQQSTNRNSEEEKKKKNEKEDDDDLTVEKYMSYPLLIRILVFHDFFSTFFLYDKVISRSIRFTIFYIRMIHCLSISTIFSQQYNEVQMIMISILNSIVLQVSLAIIQLTHRIKIIGKWVSTVAMMSLCLFYYYVILSIVSGQNAAASNYRIASFFIMVAVDFAVVAITISTFKMLIVSHMLNKKNPIKIIVKLFNLLNLQEVIQNLSI